MNLQTKIPLVKQSDNLIDYKSDVLLLGSCFAENIGNKLEYFKFKNTINPFGILFHPLAIENFITKAINSDCYNEEDIFHLNERWQCFDAHSSLSNSSKEELLNSLNKAVITTNQGISKSTHIIITLGTAWVYRFIETDKIVTNCHKVPQKKFNKELLSVDEVSNSLEAIVALIRTVNQECSIIFTVSPVRHIKDGFVENLRSKSHLNSAIHFVLESYENSKRLHYFPSYEIMMDELRDYRFYNQDMIHPNNLAVDYIWEKFQKVWISDQANKIMKEVDDIQKGLNHKPFNVESDQYLQFRNALIAKQALLKMEFPHFNF